MTGHTWVYFIPLFHSSAIVFVIPSFALQSPYILPHLRDMRKLVALFIASQK